MGTNKSYENMVLVDPTLWLVQVAWWGKVPFKTTEWMRYRESRRTQISTVRMNLDSDWCVLPSRRYPVTGPEGAQSGTFYLYIEASGRRNNEVAR